MLKHTLVGAAAMAVSLAAMNVGHADTLTFYVGGYPDSSNADTAAVAAAIAAGDPSDTLTVGSLGTLNFNSNGTTDYTIGSFLGTGGVSYTGAYANNSLDNTLFDITGSQYFHTGQTIQISHDDGASFYIGGTLVPGFSPGPTPAVTQSATYTGPSGVFGYELVYGESNGPPAVLSVVASSVVPEASTWVMMLAGFAGLGFVGFRRASKSAVSIA
jgi:hypothetical protein